MTMTSTKREGAALAAEALRAALETRAAVGFPGITGTRGRRVALGIGAGGVMAAALARCGPQGTPKADDTAKATAVPGQPATPGKFKEAPQVAQLVKDGKLPAVDQRVPKEPIVLKPVDRIGQYGGTWRMTTTGRADGAWFTRTIGYEGLVRWDPEWKNMIPSLAVKWEANTSATEFTFWLREGVKWSDGKPLTADDFVFWLEDVAKNTELTPTFPNWFTGGGKPANIVKMGENQFKYIFDGPNGLFMQNLATPSGLGIFAPAHFMKLFHKKYAGDKADAAVQEEIKKNQKNFEEEAKRRPTLKGEWPVVFNVVNDYPFSPLRPTVYAWKVVKPVGEGQVVSWERNPFFWKVDTSGNQLPYIDTLAFEFHEKQETMVLKALNGEIDMQDRHLASLQNKSVFFDGQQKGNYKLYETTGSSMNTNVIALNVAHKDAEMRKIFQDKRFRMALSHAINRKEVIDLIYVSQGEPAQPSPLKESPFYSEKLATQYLEYSASKANQLLDEMGLNRKDGRGRRLRFDGRPLFISFEVASTSEESVAYLQQVKKYWAAVGVDMEPKVEDRSLFYARKEGAVNEHDAGIWGGDGGLEVVLEPRWYFPFSDESVFATSWGLWYRSNGRQGEEPNEPAKKQMDLYRQLLATGDEKKQSDLMKQILEIAAEEFWVIGLSRPVKGYGIVRNDFHNVPTKQLGAWLYPNPGPVNPPQFFTTRR